MIATDRARKHRSLGALTRVACVVSLLVAGHRAARADDRDRALAEALFRDAKKLMDDGRFADACPKLAESQRLDPAGGTLLNLGLCHLGAKKTASAWTTLQEVVAVSKREGRADREKRARDLIAQVEPTLSVLSVSVSAGFDPPGLELTQDGVVVPRAAWGVAVPVDPGVHTVKASAPGFTAWEGKVTVGERADRQSVTVPALKAAPAVAPSASSAVVAPPVAPSSAAPMASAAEVPPASARGSSRKAIGVATFAVGAAAVGVGAYFGLRALGKQRQADDACPSDRCSPAQQRGIELSRDAAAAARVSNVGFALGAIGLGVGSYLWFFSPAPPTQGRVRGGVAVAPSVTMLSVEGGW